MDRIGVVGLCWRQGGPAALARYTLPAEERKDRVPELAARIGARELVYLATCNRVEVILVTDGVTPVAEYRRRVFAELTGTPPHPGEAERELRAWAGEGAAEHVFVVAGGLDSARLGETEITGQLRDAVELSRASGLVGDRLAVLFDGASRLARKIQRETGLGTGHTSLAEIAFDALRAHLARQRGAVVLLGVSAMTERCGRFLVGEGIAPIVVNRSGENAKRLCAELAGGASALPLDAFLAEPPSVAAVVAATGSPRALLGSAELSRLRAARGASAAPLLIDFAVPPDVDPQAARAHGLERIGMEEITAAAAENRSLRLHELGDARALVDEALATFARRLSARAVDRAIGALHRRYEHTARDQVERLLRAEFSELDEERRNLLRRFVSRLARHYAHLPATGLREAASDHGPQFLRGFFAHADAELSSAVDAALDGEELFASLRPGPAEERRA